MSNRKGEWILSLIFKDTSPCELPAPDMAVVGVLVGANVLEAAFGEDSVRRAVGGQRVGDHFANAGLRQCVLGECSRHFRRQAAVLKRVVDAVGQFDLAEF